MNGHDLHLGTWAPADLSHLGNTVVDWATLFLVGLHAKDWRYPLSKETRSDDSPSRAQRNGCTAPRPLDPGRVLGFVRDLSAAYFRY